jgi:uncharacterized protein with FMN-binding domain
MFPRRGAIALVTTAIALVLLFNFKTPDPPTSGGGVASAGGSTSTAGGSTSTAGGSSSSPATGTNGTTSATGTETLTGSIISSRYGSTEVQVTISNGKITAVTALELPSGGRSGAISRFVEPILSSEALSAQSANIDIVSGATYTSEAYAQSLQSALDQAAVSLPAAG